MTQVRKLQGKWNIDYQYSIGETAIAFLDGLAERRLVGAKCEKCERVFVPPKAFCENCFLPVGELLDIGAEGTVEAATIVTAPFAGGPEVPYCVAYVKLDGATSSIANFVRGVDLGNGTEGRELPESLAIGSSVKAVFSDEPTGRLTDFWFEPM